MIVAPTGETPVGLAAELTADAEQVPNLEPNFTLTRSRLLDLIARATAVVVMSRSEGMPNLFLEGWARGVPALSLHTGPDRRITAGDLGICCRGSWPRFVAAAKQRWSDPALRRELGEHARAYVRDVRDVHSPEAVGARWQTVVQGVLV
jgi:glycosyltransferase involved in cell wall biosynthesis